MAAMEAEETEEEISPQFQKKLSSTDPPTMQEYGVGFDLCPSFNSYTIDGLAETAARVTMEFEGIADEEDEFEFVSFQKTDEQMFLNCPMISPLFPIFNHDLMEKSDGTEVNELSHENAPIVRISLAKLIIDDRESERVLDRDPPLPSSSSSEADELDGVPPGTYCVWTPKPADQRGKCKKSKSTGSRSSGSSSSSRRWRLRNLLPRSNSEGGKKNLFVFLTPSSKSESTRKLGEEDAKGKKRCSEDQNAVVAGKSKASSSSAHELFYVRNRMMKEEDKRRSYLPYRQDLVGFWANLSSVSKALPPF